MLAAAAVAYVLVDLELDLVWSKWPFSMARDAGRCCRTCFEVNSGHDVRWPASMARHHVEMVGENMVEW